MPRDALRPLLGVLVLLVAACGDPPAPAEPALEVVPATLDFGRVRWAVAVPMEVRVRNRSPRPVRLGTIESDSAAVTLAARPERETLAPGDVVRFTVAFQSGHAKVGPFRASVTIASDDPAARRLVVPVVADVAEAR